MSSMELEFHFGLKQKGKGVSQGGTCLQGRDFTQSDSIAGQTGTEIRMCQ